MSKKLLTIVLMLALLAGVVAVGIHVLHKDALASTKYQVYIYMDPPEAPRIDLEDGIVKMKFEILGEWTDWVIAINEGDGIYSRMLSYYPSQIYHWQVVVSSPEDFDPVDPPSNPVTHEGNVTSFSWEGEWNPE